MDVNGSGVKSTCFEARLNGGCQGGGRPGKHHKTGEMDS